ncbi:unnamed protein product [Urochloa decumbens]|uniref:Ankyrin repeat protein n=1 Tax=Urochloa decumbens TaxID=240449 RepID=A0ABC8VHV7_9POAL
MVKLLLAHGANLNKLSHDRRTPLVASIFGSSLECLRTFIEEGADITGSPVTPLSVAARKGLPDCIECLLNYNADPNEPNEYGKLPLEIAASKRWKECFDILARVTNPLQKYANLGDDEIVQQEMTDGELPLEIAASKRWRECFEILFPVTNPLPKYANLGDDEIVQQEMTVCFVEEYLAIGEGDSAFWKKEYTHALGCYNLALKLGHEDPSLYAKRSLCHLGNSEPLRYLDDALSYMNAKGPYAEPCSEEDAKQSVLDYLRGWRTRYRE